MQDRKVQNQGNEGPLRTTRALKNWWRGSVGLAADLRGGDSFNSSFLCRFFSEFNSGKKENWSTSNKNLPFGARGPVIMTHRVQCDGRTELVKQG